MQEPDPRPVVGLHFVCRERRGVTPLSDGCFESGGWKIDAKHTDTAKYLALHERQKDPSYLQGAIVGHRRDPKSGRFFFRVLPEGTPLTWPPDSGNGEKGFAYE